MTTTSAERHLSPSAGEWCPGPGWEDPFDLDEATRELLRQVAACGRSGRSGTLAATAAGVR